MDKVYQVFVSSTFSDLEDERKAVSDTLAKAGFIPSGMELFPATDQQQLEFIKRIIDRCDYYVVIVGARYGSLDGDKSFTEKEYEYAVSKKIPVLAFIHKDPGKIASEKVESDPEQIKRLNLFRTRLKASRIVNFWTSVSDLRTEVLTAVTNAVNLSPGIGWIRGDQAIDPKILQELERLRIDNSNLIRKLQEIEGDEINFPANLVGPDDTLDLALDIEHLGGQDIYGQREITANEEITVSANLGALFEELFDHLIIEPAEYSLKPIIGDALLRQVGRATENTRGKVSEQTVVSLRFHFEALGLIQAIGQEHVSHLGGPYSRTSNYIAWAITNKGRRFATLKRAIHK